MRFSRALSARHTPRTMDAIMRLLLLSLCGYVACDRLGGLTLGRLFQRRRDAYNVYAQNYANDYEPYMFAAIPLHAPVPVLRVLSRAPLPLGPRDAQPAPSARHTAYTRPYTHSYAEQHHYPEQRQHPEQRQYPEQRRYPEPTTPYSEQTRHYAKPARPYAAATDASEHDFEATSYDYRDRDYSRQTLYQKPRRQVAPAQSLEYATDYDSYAPQIQGLHGLQGLQVIHPSPLPQLTYALAPYDASSQEAAPTVLYARPSPSGGFTYRRLPSASTPKKVVTPLKEKEKETPYIIKIHKYRIVKDDLI